MMAHQDTVRRRVRRGVALLDKKGPRDWRERINQHIFRIDDATTCVLGQVFNGYCRGLNLLDLTSGDLRVEIANGFLPSMGDHGDSDWPLLERAWIKELWGHSAVA